MSGVLIIKSLGDGVDPIGDLPNLNDRHRSSSVFGTTGLNATRYSCMYILNDTLDPVTILNINVESTDNIKIGLIGAVINATAELLDNNTTAPTGVNFAVGGSSMSYDNVILQPNDYLYFWLSIPPASGVKSKHSANITTEWI